METFHFCFNLRKEQTKELLIDG